MRPSKLPQLLSTADDDSIDVPEPHPRCTVALIQNTANEVGFAALDTTSVTTIWIAQYVEPTRSFLTTRTMLELHPPDEVLVVSSKAGCARPLAVANLDAALDRYPKVHLERNMFDDTEGTVLLEECASEKSSAELLRCKSNYLAMGAAGALLRYFQEEKRLLIPAHSIEVCFILSPHHTQLDVASINTLELVAPIPQYGQRRKSGISLFKFLDGTSTKAGAQLLRANILQPLRDIPTLNARFDALEELKNIRDLMLSVTACLGQMPHNIEGMCASLILQPAKSESGTIRRIQAMVSAFIQLKGVLTSLPKLATLLSSAESSLLKSLNALFSSERLSELLVRLEGVLDDDVHPVKGAFLNRTQQCFAIRAGIDPLLDISRQKFCECADAVHELAEQLRNSHDIESLKVQYNSRRGFYFSVRKNDKSEFEMEDINRNERMTDGMPHFESIARSFFNNGHISRKNDHINMNFDSSRRTKRRNTLQLPSIFTILRETTQAIQLTTDALNALNGRLKQASDECLCQTEEILERVSADILENYMHTLRRIVDGIAVLDMVCGFAKRIDEVGRHYIRPTLTEFGPVALVELRHPILEDIETCNYQPNDIYLGFESSLHVITGPNMSGKSSHLRAAALSLIMAQIGCFVPASFASLTPIDRLMTRMGTSDSLENNSSSFMVETQEVAYILRHATSDSLVIIDELGRATSTADGISIAWSVAEALVSKGSLTLLATHFQELADLARLYPQVQTYHFDVHKSTNGKFLEYTWKLMPGPPVHDHYGLDLAEAVGFPSSVLENAKCIVEGLDSDKESKLLIKEITEQQWEQRVALWGAFGKLICLAQAYEFAADKSQILDELRVLQKELKSVNISEFLNHGEE